MTGNNFNITGYDFRDFNEEFSFLYSGHPHVIRREQGVTYHDEYAKSELCARYQELYDQYIPGWSRSFYLGSKHMESIRQYDSINRSAQDIEVSAYKKAYFHVQERLRSLPIVRAFDVLTELDLVKFESTSAAGYNYFGRKGEVGGENHIKAIRQAKAILWSSYNQTEGIDHIIKQMVPDVGYTRTQLADVNEKTKVRGVWGRAFHYILLEGTSAHPLLNAFVNSNTFIHIGPDPTNSVPHLLSAVSETCKWLYAIDWSQFDATVHRFEIHAAFDLLKEHIFFPNKETEQAFEISRQLFIHKKIAAPDGNVYWSHKGIPSGSYYTSMIGSIVNMLRITYMWFVLKERPPSACFVQGDDSLSGDDERIEPIQFQQVAEPAGWILHPNKTEISRYPEGVTFLGRTSSGGMNARDLKRCLRLLILPEYPVPSGAISAYRAHSIAKDAGGLSVVLNEISRALERKYGRASEKDVPKQFIIYRFAV
nr:RNA-dependent RNA polymerase [Partitiviridae sp.]